MSKNLLEELLIQAGTLNEETEKRVNKNQKVVIENTMASAVRNFIQEAVGEEETEEELEGLDEVYTEEEVDAETGEKLTSEEDEDYSEEELDSEEEELDSEEDEDYDSEEDEDYDSEEDEDYDSEEDEDYDSEEDEDYDSEEDEDYDSEEDEDYDSEEDEDMYGDDTDLEDEEEVMDMTKADISDVMKFIEDSDEDVVIQVVKQPTYDVKVSGGSKRMPSGMKSSMGDEEDVELEIDETVLMEMMKELKSEMKGMRKEEIKDIYEDESEDFSGDITLEIEGLDEEMEKFYDEKGTLKSVKDEKGMYNVTPAEVQAENRRLKNQINKLIAENKKLKINETKSIAALKSMIEQTKQVALVNSNLAYVSRLFTEHSTTKQEKVAILKQFDSAKTLKESEMTFKILTESLVKRTQKKTLNVNINEAVDLNKQKVVKEEKAYVNDPEQEKILRLMDYKSTL